MHQAPHHARRAGTLAAHIALAHLLACYAGSVAVAQTAGEAGGVAARTGTAAACSQPASRPAPDTNDEAAANRRSAPRCTGEAVHPGTLSVPLGKSRMVRVQEPVVSRAIGNPDVAQASLVAPQALYVLGVDVGTTNLIIQGKSGACTIMDIVVGMDPDGLQASLSQLLPEEKEIKVTSAADTLVLSGTASDATAVMRAMELANAFARRPSARGNGGDGQEGGARAQPKVVNLLSVSAPQQVMLEVKVAEVSKSLLDKLGFRTSLSTTDGSWAYTLLSNFLTGTANGLFDAAKTNGNRVTLEAEKRDGSVKILAEPTVMAISGQEGSFLAGGKIMIPVAQDSGIGGIKVTLEEKEFGVGVKFTPTVLAGGRINLKVTPEVSELSREGVGISAVGVSGSAILPLITTRRAATTVQLHDGQSFAIGGLIKNNVVANIKALPVLGEVPILGTLFRSTDFQQDKTELLFVVTPRLVKPLPPNFALPTDNLPDPSRTELFLGGKLEDTRPVGAPGAPAAALPAEDRLTQRDDQRGAAGFELK